MTTLFKNAQVIDGTERQKYRADVFVNGTTIAKISTKAEEHQKADETIDASGKILCPGFMDIHAHSELEVLRDPCMRHKTGQGITFDLSGNCGVGNFPRRENDPQSFADILGHWDNWKWTDFSSYARQVKTGMNIGFLQNHAMLRKYAIEGNPNRAASKDEVKVMCRLLDNALDSGCFGFSSGIYYAPNIFADRYEFTELLKVVKNHDALFTVHHRCEGTEIISSIEEVLSYVRQTGVKLEISHLKTIGINNAGKTDTVLEMIHNMKQEGFEIGFDQYPYNYGSTSLFSLLPPSYLRLEQKEMLKALSIASTDEQKKKELIYQIENADGWDSIIPLCGFDNISAVILESSPEFNGMTISQCSEKLKTDCYTALFTLLSRETKCALMMDKYQSDETTEKIMKDSLMCFGTDALYAGSGAHPRSGNAAIHMLSEYCKNKKVLTYEQAISRMTKRVADRLGIKDRGVVKEGNKADLVLFDPEELKDNSDPANPYAKCSGLDYVMVNGQFAVKEGKPTESVSGEVLFKN